MVTLQPPQTDDAAIGAHLNSSRTKLRNAGAAPGATPS
jgi:hypothetical protein